MMNKRLLMILVPAIGLLGSISSAAHHAFSAFHRDQMIELEGEVTSLRWANPHVRIDLRVTNADGSTRDWSVEGQSTAILGRIGMSPELFAVGSTIRVAGWPGRNDRPLLGLTNAMVDGKEYLTFTQAAPIWTEVDDANPLLTAGITSEDTSIFRVWSTDFDGTERNLWETSYPLTEFAQSIQAQGVLGVGGFECIPKGMPTIMEQPYPMEFIREGENIVLRLEEYDSVRTIHMGDDVSESAGSESIFGYSRGRWEGSTLVVMTSGVSGWDHFDKTGIPQTPAMTFVERFTPSTDGRTLQYTLVANDPAIFTEPVTLDREWVWRPGEEVRPYNCTTSE